MRCPLNTSKNLIYNNASRSWQTIPTLDCVLKTLHEARLKFPHKITQSLNFLRSNVSVSLNYNQCKIGRQLIYLS